MSSEADGDADLTGQALVARELRRHRERAGLSLNKLAQRVGYSRTYISTSEKPGADLISEEVVKRVDGELHAGGALVELRARADVERKSRRAPADAVPSHPGPAAPSRTDEPITDDVVDVLSRVQKLGRRVNPEIICHLQADLADMMVQYEKIDHVSLVPTLLKQRVWTESLLEEVGHPRQRQQLYEIAGATSGLLGYAAVGRGRFPLARAYCFESFELGDFAQDSNLQAWARGLQSFCEYYAQRYDDALKFAADGLNYAGSGPQSVRLAVNGVARAMGKLGDADGVRRAVENAYELMSLNDVPSGLPSSISLECYSAAQAASNAATAYLSLGESEKVQEYVSQAMPEIDISESPWSRSLVMIDLSSSLIRSREADLDRATGLIIDALSISDGRPIISVQQRTAEFVRDASDRWGKSTQIDALRDAMLALEGR